MPPPLQNQRRTDSAKHAHPRLAVPSRPRPDRGSSDLQGVKVGDAGFHQVQVHLDEVVLYATGFRGGEDFLPIQGVLPDSHDFFGLRGPALDVHGKEAARIFGEIFGGVVALADGGNLELEFDEPGIEKVEQQVVGALAVNHGELEVLIVKALLDTGFSGKFAHFVVFAGGALHVIHGGFLGPAEAGHDHLRQADILGPGNACLLIVAQLLDAEVRTNTGDTGIAQNFLEFGSAVFGEASEAVLGITYRRAQLNGLKSGLSKQLDGGGKVFGNHLLDSPGLTPDGQAKRIGAKFQGAYGKEAGSGGAGTRVFEKFSSRNHGHLEVSLFTVYSLRRFTTGLLTWIL